MRFFFIVVGAALGIGVAVGLPLAWDGGAILFYILDWQAPVVVLNRLSMLPLNAFVLLVSKITADFSILALTYSAVHTLITFVVLLLCWQFTRSAARTRPLFVWAALGICLVSLPAQAIIMAQAVEAVQLFWILLFALVVGVPRSTLPFLVIISLFIFFLHPVSILIFTTLTLCAFVLGWRNRAQRRTLWLTAIVFFLVSVIAAVRFALLVSPYETEGVSAHTLLLYYNNSLRGFPLIAFLSALVSASLIFVQPRLAPSRTTLLRGVRLAAILLLLVAGAALWYWMTSPIRWARALDYRTWLFFLTLPFAVLAVADAVLPPLQNESALEARTLSELWLYRRRVVQLIAVLFFCVLATQSYVWLQLSNQLRAAIASSDKVCIPAIELGWTRGTALEHWSISAYAFVLQDRTPAHFVLDKLDCAAADFSKGLPIAVYTPESIDYRPWGSGWFQLEPMRQELQQTPP